MAKTSQVMRDRRREVLIEKYAAKRAELRKQLKDPATSLIGILELQFDFTVGQILQGVIDLLTGGR